jgi:hypothetical protein
MSNSGCAGNTHITPLVVSAAMSMIVARTEDEHHFVAFSHTIIPLMIDGNTTLDEAVLELMQTVNLRH